MSVGDRTENLSSGHEFDSSSSFQGQLNYLSLNTLPHKLAMKVI